MDKFSSSEWILLLHDTRLLIGIISGQHVWQRANINNPPGITRISAFQELPYWHSLSLQHYLDPMHIFKNVCKSLISHLVEKTL